MQQHKPDYRILALLSVFIGGVLVAGALLAPPLFFAAQSYIQSHPDSSLSALLSKSEFPGYFNRAAMLAAFIGLIPMLRSLHMTRRQMTGDLTARQGWPQLGLGFGVALVWIAAMGIVCFAAEACRLKSSPGWGGIAMPLASGFTVAAMEELLFRGAALGMLSHSLGARRGLWWTTLFFALVHFLKPPAHGTILAEQVTWTSGFWVIPQLFRGFGQWNNFIGEFVLLFAVGWVLATARQRTGGLWLSIGLHAGWVAGMKYFSQIIATTPSLNNSEFAPWLVRNTCRSIVSPIVGVVPVLAVLLTGIVALSLARRMSGTSSEKGVASQPN